MFKPTMGDGVVRWPASVFQRSVVQLDELMPGVMTRPTETTGITVRVRGPLDLDVLDRAFGELVARHELLRTRIVRDDTSTVLAPDPAARTGAAGPGSGHGVEAGAGPGGRAAAPGGTAAPGGGAGAVVGADGAGPGVGAVAPGGMAAPGGGVGAVVGADGAGPGAGAVAAPGWAVAASGAVGVGEVPGGGAGGGGGTGSGVWQEVLPPVPHGEPGAPRLARLPAGDERPVSGGASWPIPLDDPPLARAAVVQVDEREHLLGLTLHHVVADQSSAALAMRDLALVYSARVRGATPPPIPLQHGAYALWQQRRLAERAERDQQAWSRALEGVTPPRYRRTLPFRPGTSAVAATLRRTLLDAAECEAVAGWSQRRHCTTFATFLAAFARTLATRTDARDLPIMSAFEQRDNPAIRNLPGPFLYPTLLRVPVDDDESPYDLVCRVRDILTATFSRAQVTMMDLATLAPTLLPGVLGLEPSWLRLFQYQPGDTVATPFRFGDAVGRAVSNEGRGTHALAYGALFHLWHDADGALVAHLGYDSTELDEPAAASLLDDWATTVRSFLT